MARLLALRPALIPQQVRLNRAHPAARWCTALITFPNGSPVDWVNGRVGGTSWGTRPVGRVHRGGTGADNTAGAGGCWISDPAGRYTPQNYTHLLVSRVVQRYDPRTYCTLMSAGAADGSSANCTVRMLGDFDFISVTHATADFDLSSGVAFDSMIVDSTTHAWAVASANSDIRVLYRDGVRLSEWGSGRATPGSITNGRLVWLSDRDLRTTDRYMLGQVFMHAVFNRRLPENLLQDITLDPYALIGA